MVSAHRRLFGLGAAMIAAAGVSTFAGVTLRQVPIGRRGLREELQEWDRRFAAGEVSDDEFVSTAEVRRRLGMSAPPRVRLLWSEQALADLGERRSGRASRPRRW